MSRTSQALLTALITYMLVHLVYLTFGFNPIHTWPHALGWIIDFAIWALVYYVIYLALGKLTNKSK